MKPQARLCGYIPCRQCRLPTWKGKTLPQYPTPYTKIAVGRLKQID